MKYFLSPIIIILILIFLIIILLFIRSSFECRTYRIKEYFIKNNKNSSKLKIVFLTDFHNKRFEDGNLKLIYDILNVNPDYIILGGDFIDFSALNSKFGSIYYQNTIDFISKLRLESLKLSSNNNYNLKRIFFSYGNHELRLKQKSYIEANNIVYEKFIKSLTDNDIEIADNNTFKISDGITLSGLTLYEGYYYNIFKSKSNYEHITNDVLSNCFGDLDSSNFNIVLFHKPDYADDLIKYGFDLVLSGHNHGGLIEFPVIGPIFSPDFKLFPKYNAGLYKISNGTLIVSRGIGEHFIKIRVNNMPTFYVININ